MLVQRCVTVAQRPVAIDTPVGNVRSRGWLVSVTLPRLQSAKCAYLHLGWVISKTKVSLADTPVKR